MLDMFKELKQRIEKHGAFAVVCHKRPDGDAIGSALSFARYLRSIGKECKIYCQDPIPLYFSFLHGLDEMQKSPDEFWDLSHAIIILDCGDLNMPGFSKHHFDNRDIFVIDHHSSNSGYGIINAIDSSACATSEILCDYFAFAEFSIGRECATNLLCGIYTDTDGFTNLATTPKSLRLCSELLSLGARFRDITAFTMRTKSIASLKLWGRALERLRLDTKNQIATTVIKRNDFEECGAADDDAEGVSSVLNHLSGIKMAMVLREIGDGTIKASLRTTDDSIDVSKIALQNGGGGHKKAAGFTVRGKIIESDEGWKIID